jgi:hypothetical protein
MHRKSPIRLTFALAFLIVPCQNFRYGTAANGDRLLEFYLIFEYVLAVVWFLWHALRWLHYFRVLPLRLIAIFMRTAQIVEQLAVIPRKNRILIMRPRRHPFRICVCVAYNSLEFICSKAYKSDSDWFDVMRLIAHVRLFCCACLR